MTVTEKAIIKAAYSFARSHTYLYHKRCSTCVLVKSVEADKKAKSKKRRTP
jgi:hypothetical protein